MKPALLAHARTQKQIDQYLGSPAHALGIYGDNGAGKGYIAIFLAAKLLNVSMETVSAHPYVLKVDAIKQKSGIEDIRQLQKFLTLTVPDPADIKRVVIIEHIDILGHEAQNALLKTLEEPPADTIIIVTYARHTSILPTIHSRLRFIQILPVTQARAAAYFESSEANFDKSFFISGGQVGLLAAILHHQADHLLLKAIDQARLIIGMARHQRLGLVDKLTKNKDIPISLLLDGLYRLVDASYRQALKTKSRHELKATIQRLRLVESAIDDLDKNVQAKLVMSRLFLEL